MLSAASGFDRLSTSSLGHPLEISAAIKFGRDSSNVAYNIHLKAAHINEIPTGRGKGWKTTICYNPSQMTMHSRATISSPTNHDFPFVFFV
jgi:hypothetical protein